MLLRETLNTVTAIVLASGSPRRKELLAQMLPQGVDFVVRKSTFEEDLPKGADAAQYCVSTAAMKGEEVCAAVADPSQLIISADTVVVLENEVLEKPADGADAARMLSRVYLPGRRGRARFGVLRLRQHLSERPRDTPCGS